MNRLVNISMIFILLTCPVRCMLQGCGCYAPSEHSCCSVMPECCCDTECDCGEEDADSRRVPPLAPKCKCNCFCSGAIVADVFDLQEDQSAQVLFNAIASDDAAVSFRSLMDSDLHLHPPDPLKHSDANNRGREIRCLINSFVI